MMDSNSEYIESRQIKVWRHIKENASIWSSIILLFLIFLTACNQGSQSQARSNDRFENEQNGNESQIGESDETGQNSPADTGLESQESGTSSSDNEPSEQADPVENSVSEKELVICTSGPAPRLFLYGDSSGAAVDVRHTIYENLFTSAGYAYQAQGLVKLPSLRDGDARIKTAVVQEGDLVVDEEGRILKFQDGVSVITIDNEVHKFDGTSVEMGQMVADFTFKPMVWSDGIPITAEDSVFSFQLAANPQNPSQNRKVAYTAKYEAIGELSTRWTGLPGYIDQTYFTNVWEPLPQHQLGEIPFEELQGSNEASFFPLSSGPYIINEWREDGSLVLDKNPYYYRQTAGLPLIGRLVIYFGNGENFLSGGSSGNCDVITNSVLGLDKFPLLNIAVQQDSWEILSQPGNVFEQIAVGINPTFDYAERRPDWFEDARVRQAIAMCTDRQRMVDELTGGYASLLNAYVPDSHPMYPDDVLEWPYDLNKANSLLDEAGYKDVTGDGRRQDIATGIPMTITLGTNSESPLRISITESVRNDLADCGIPVETYELSAGSWFFAGPQGRVFGRQFDLAALAWLGQNLPDCGLYLSDNISGPPEEGFGGWQNVNVTGWSNEEYDNACRSALTTLPGGVGYEEFQKEAIRIYSRELPSIPLFTNVLLSAIRPGLKNIHLDASQPSMLWNVYEWDYAE